MIDARGIEEVKALVKNGKYFVAPQQKNENFKVLFARLAAAGAGRPADHEGFPDGPWTPESLTDAICAIPANSAGIELRAVQVWFQDNDIGIGIDNIRWLARIFGCSDPDATSKWQDVFETSPINRLMIGDGTEHAHLHLSKGEGLVSKVTLRTNTGPMQIELIEQHDDTPSVYHFHKEGPVFQMHHLASWLTKSDYDLEMADCDKRGLEIVQQGVLAGSGACFTYFGSLDRQEKLLFEITDIDQPSPMARMNRIQSAAENWDGRDIILKPQS